jgi:hypothetical protein
MPRALEAKFQALCSLANVFIVAPERYRIK